jgi:hypothetical protein
MKIWIRIRRTLDRIVPKTRALERLARRQAFQLKGLEVLNFEIYTEEGGAYIEFRHPQSRERLMLWTSQLPVARSLHISYSVKAERRLVTIYGRNEYRANPGAYLRITS